MGVIIPDLSQLPNIEDNDYLVFDNEVVSYAKTAAQLKAFINSGMATQAALQAAIDDLDALETAHAALVGQFNNLVVKQNNEKLIQAIAVNRTFKATAGNADIIASDAATGAYGAWIDRDLNHGSQTPNSSAYFSLDTANKRIRILQAGSYEVYFESHLRRGNFCALMAEYRPPTGDFIFKLVKERTATGATTVGSDAHIAASMILNIPSGREGGYIYLAQWTETNSSNERYGLWYCRGSAGAPYNYVDTCTLKVTLIA